MPSPLRSLIESGTKLWLDGIDPQLIIQNRAWGATGATSNPAIISNLIQTGRFDPMIQTLAAMQLSDTDIAWQLTDTLVRDAQAQFMATYDRTTGNDGYASFELDPLLEDPASHLTNEQRTRLYIQLGTRWGTGHSNRLIKVPATASGIAALEELAAGGIKINVTLIFTPRQYHAARNAIWRGLQRSPLGLKKYKSVYSIFISRIDVWTSKHRPDLAAAQGQVGIALAKQLWTENQKFWAHKGLTLRQEIIFASTGVKLPGQQPDLYVAALAGSDIQTNPHETNQAVQELGRRYSRTVDQPVDPAVLDEIDRKLDLAEMEKALIDEGIAKFADPFKTLVALIGRTRASLRRAG